MSAHSFNLNKRWWNKRSLEEYINLLIKNKLPIEGVETLTKENHYNEIILNGLRLKEGVSISHLKKYNNIITKNNFDKINQKWDCLSISKKKIKLIDNGFLFVDEISSDMFC